MIRSFSHLSNEKLFYINNIKLPKEIIEIIKQFSLINRIDAMLICYMQHKKKIINSLIDVAISRNNSYGLWNNIEKNSHWIFGFIHPHSEINSLQLQGENCPKCGEYKLCTYNRYTDAKCTLPICNCPDNIYYIEHFPYGNYEHDIEEYWSESDSSIS